MERGNTKHGPRLDEEMEREVRGTLQGTAGSRVEEWKMAEPAGEDQPEPTTVPAGDYRTHGDSAQRERMSRLGRYIGLSALPGDRTVLRASAQVLEAPDDILAALDRLPEGVTYATVAEIWDALDHQV
jgi:hypothetical protein